MPGRSVRGAPATARRACAPSAPSAYRTCAAGACRRTRGSLTQPSPHPPLLPRTRDSRRAPATVVVAAAAPPAAAPAPAPRPPPAAAPASSPPLQPSPSPSRRPPPLPPPPPPLPPPPPPQPTRLCRSSQRCVRRSARGARGAVPPERATPHAPPPVAQRRRSGQRRARRPLPTPAVAIRRMRMGMRIEPGHRCSP